MIETVIDDGFKRCVCEHANTRSPKGWCCGALGRSGACGDINPTGYVLCDDVRDTPECLKSACDVKTVEIKLVIPKSPQMFDRKSVPDWIIRANKAELDNLTSEYGWCLGKESE